jgi:hypothetical protein
LLAIIELKRLVDVDEKTVSTPDSTADLEQIVAWEAVLKVVADYEEIAKPIEMALMDFDVILKGVPSVGVTSSSPLELSGGAHNP